MKNFKRCLLILVLTSSGVQLRAQDLTGTWEGQMLIYGTKHEIIFYLSKSNGNFYTGVEYLKGENKSLNKYRNGLEASVKCDLLATFNNNALKVKELSFIEKTAAIPQSLTLQDITLQYDNSGGQERLHKVGGKFLEVIKKNNEFPPEYAQYVSKQLITLTSLTFSGANGSNKINSNNQSDVNYTIVNNSNFDLDGINIKLIVKNGSGISASENNISLSKLQHISGDLKLMSGSEIPKDSVHLSLEGKFNGGLLFDRELVVATSAVPSNNRIVVNKEQSMQPPNDGANTQQLQQPGADTAFFKRGNIFFEQKKYELAIKEYTQAISLNPTDIKYLFKRGNAYMESLKVKTGTKDYSVAKLALQDFSDAIKIKPSVGVLYYQHARALAILVPSGYGLDYQSAHDMQLSDYLKAYQLGYTDAYDSIILIGLEAAINIDMGENIDKDQPINDFTDAINVAPNLPKAYVYRASAYEEEEEYELAMNDCETAIRLDPGYYFAYDVKGNILKSQNEYDSAILNYTKAITLNPNSESTCEHRARLYAKMKKFDLAINDCSKCIKLDPNDQDLVKALKVLKTHKDPTFW